MTVRHRVPKPAKLKVDVAYAGFCEGHKKDQSIFDFSKPLRVRSRSTVKRITWFSQIAGVMPDGRNACLPDKAYKARRTSSPRCHLLATGHPRSASRCLVDLHGHVHLPDNAGKHHFF